MYALLIISENEEHFTTIEKYLNSSIYSENLVIEYCKTPKEALEYLHQNIASMIIVDSQIVFQYDKDFIQKIKAYPLFLDKPLCIIATPNQRDVEDFKEENTLFYPLQKEDVINKIINSLDSHYVQSRLIEEIFSQSKEHKEQMSLLKDRMLLIFTHELKTPLNAIISFSSYINRGLKKKITREKLNKFAELSELIEVNGKVLLEEINTLLDIAKIKEQKMIFELESIRFDQLIKNSVEKYKLLYNKNVDTDIEELSLLGDTRSLIHIFENLYSNALKYAKSQVLVTLKQENENFFLTVEDDGEGIEEDQRDAIFELFEQTEQTTLNREKEGTGIGLYIVKLLCEHFKYSITVEDSDLGGAIFTIEGAIQ